jgi:hypothetical protein
MVWILFKIGRIAFLMVTSPTTLSLDKFGKGHFHTEFREDFLDKHSLNSESYYHQKIIAYDSIVLIFNTYDDVRIVSRIGIRKCNM